jgi:ribonuclease D
MFSESLPDPHWIATPSDLQSLTEELRRWPHLAVDTESNGLYAYRERVCLIQFSTPKADYLVDPLALGDVSPLAFIFADPKIEKVFHAAEYDLLGLKRDFGFQVLNLFDTMQSARILGYQQVGLDALLGQKFGLKVDKRFQKANWGQRPLPAELMTYARLDTHYLLALRDLLEAELQQKDLLLLARDDFSLLAQPEEPKNGRSKLWLRAARPYHLTPRQRTVLSALAQARDDLACRYDRPVFKIIRDDLLVELACQTPHDKRGLLNAGLTSRQAEYFGAELLQAIQKGREMTVVQMPAAVQPDPLLSNRLRALGAWRKKVARKMGVDSDVVLPRRYLEGLAQNPPQDLEALAEVMRLSPWRFHRFGKEILSVLGVGR